MVFDDFDLLYNQIQEDIYEKLTILGKEIKKDIENYIETNIVKAYSPNVYDRTGEIEKCVIVEPVSNIKGEFYLEIYISEDYHKDESNWTSQKRTFDEILQFFEDGQASWRDNEKIETMSLAQKEWIDMKRALTEIKNMLKKKYDILNL